MGSDPCDACGERVSIGGGISGLWSSDPEGTGGMTLAFDDGTEQFLCFACIDSLPEDPTAADVGELVDG